MLLDNILNLFFRNVLSHLFHCILDIFFSNITVIVCVKLREDSTQATISHELVDTHGSSQELSVIDLTITMVINLVNKVIYLLVRHVKISLSKDSG